MIRQDYSNIHCNFLIGNICHGANQSCCMFILCQADGDLVSAVDFSPHYLVTGHEVTDYNSWYIKSWSKDLSSLNISSQHLPLFFPGFLRRCVETSGGNANPHADRAQRGSDRDFTSRKPCCHLLLWLYGKENGAKKRALSFDQRVANCDKTTKICCQIFASLSAVRKLSWKLSFTSTSTSKSARATTSTSIELTSVTVRVTSIKKPRNSSQPVTRPPCPIKRD